MVEKLVLVSMCEQQAVIRFLNGEWRNGNEIHEKLCNVSTKAISQSNVYKWIKKLNEGLMKLPNEGWSGHLLDLINEETCRIGRCLLDDDRHLTISDLHHKIAAQYMYVNVSQTSIYQILTNKLKMTKKSARWILWLTFLNTCWKILNGKFLNNLRIALISPLPTFTPFHSWKLNYRVGILLMKKVFMQPAADAFRKNKRKNKFFKKYAFNSYQYKILLKYKKRIEFRRYFTYGLVLQRKIKAWSLLPLGRV